MGSVIFAIGLWTGSISRPTASDPPLIIERRDLSPAPAAATGKETERELAGERLPGREETVYICGARTKKGTPCSRRVRDANRCWQHRGKPAMLPAAKLILTG